MTEHPTSPPSDATVIERTQDWVNRFVVGLNLCPFARRVLDVGQVRFSVSRDREPADLLDTLRAEMQRLLSDDSIATTILIHPDALEDFLAYNDFLDDVDRLLRREGLEGVLQVASFHPAYQFADTSFGDPENFSNRSPWPMLHLLREDDVADAIDRHPDAEGIPDENIETLRRIGSSRLLDLWRGFRGEAPSLSLQRFEAGPETVGE
jgi:hypothetical protein